MKLSNVFLILFCNWKFAVSTSSQNATELHLEMAGNFIKESRKTIRGSNDESWMYKFMSNNSLLPSNSSSSQSSSSSVLSDDSSASLVVLSDTVGTAACASGWTRYDGTGMCYMESSDTYTWYEAEAWCWSQRAGAHLASVHSQAEAKWLAAQYKLWYAPMDDWIGLRRACDNVTYFWTDGSAVFQWWQPDYPQSAYAEESCTTIWDTDFLLLVSGYIPGQFDDMKDCGEGGSSALCKYDPNSDLVGEPYSPQVCTTPGPTTIGTTTVTTTTVTTTTATPTTTTILTTTVPTTPFNTALCSTPANCPANWIHYSLKCYALLSGAFTWAQAGQGCQSEGGTLVDILDADENEALREAFSNNLVPSSASLTSQAWIGNSTSYTNWAVGQPTASGAQYCNVFALSADADWGYSRGVWGVDGCSSTQKYAICSKPVGSS